MSHVEELLLRREQIRAVAAVRLAGFLIRLQRDRPYDPDLCDRIEAALDAGSRSEELAAALRDRIAADKTEAPAA